LATGAILFREGNFAAKAGRLDDKTRFLVGNESWNDLYNSAHSSKAYVTRLQSFPQGGYYVFGSDLGEPDEIRIIADAGPLGYLSIAAHGHADALAMLLSVRGREFLIDPGTFLYHGNEKWRQYFRGTRAHNTVCVDASNQSESGGAFIWMKRATSRCINYRYGASGDEFLAEHDGYMRLADPVMHLRRINRSGRTIKIVDTLDCEGEHLVERCWHFSERCSVDVDNRQIYAVNESEKIRMEAGDTVTEIVRAFGDGLQPIGWLSRSFHVKQATTSIIMKNKIVGTTSLTTTIQCD